VFERKNLIGLLLIFGLTLPSVLFGQSADQVKKLQQALIKMQLEMEEYQGELQDQFSEQRQLVEESKTEIAQLNRLSQELQEKVKTLETELALSKQQIDEMRASSSKAQFNESSLVVSALMLAESGDSASMRISWSGGRLLPSLSISSNCSSRLEESPNSASIRELTKRLNSLNCALLLEARISSICCLERASSVSRVFTFSCNS
jgi:uncharacterized membrane-anchored protein YhcB (DUF1043 family)